MSGERKRNLKNFFQLLMRYKWHHIAAMIFSVLNSVLVLLQPIFLMKIIDEGITNLDMASLLKNILYFIGIIIVQNICEYFTTYIYSIIGKRFILDLRIRVIKHVESMSGEFFTNTDASEIFTIFDDDIDNIEQLASKMIFSVISDICIAIIMCIYLGHLQLELFTAILVIQPIMFIVQKKINRNSNNLAFEARSTLGEIIKQVQEYLLSMIQYIKLNAKNVFWRRYKKSSDEYVHKCIGLDMAYCKSGVLGSLLSGFRQNGVDRVMCVLVLQTVCGLADRAQLLTRAQAGGRRHGDARVDTALQAGDADHEELVKVRGEDRGEVGALEQGHVFVLRTFEHALVELEPAELAVEETVLGQRCLAFLIDAAVVVVVFGNMLCDLAAQNCLRGCVKYLCHSLYRKLWRGRKTTERARIQRVFMLVRCWLVLSVLASLATRRERR